MITDTRNSAALPTLMPLCPSVGAMFSVTTQAAEASPTMTSTPASAASLSSQQQAIQK